MDLSEIIVVYDIKVGRCCQQKEYMKLHEYQSSRSFTDLVPRSSDATFSNFFSLENAGRLKPNFIWSLHGMGERKFVQMVQVKSPIWPPCLYMVKPLNIFSGSKMTLKVCMQRRVLEY